MSTFYSSTCKLCHKVDPLERVVRGEFIGVRSWLTAQEWWCSRHTVLWVAFKWLLHWFKACLWLRNHCLLWRKQGDSTGHQLLLCDMRGFSFCRASALVQAGEPPKFMLTNRMQRSLDVDRQQDGHTEDRISKAGALWEGFHPQKWKMWPLFYSGDTVLLEIRYCISKSSSTYKPTVKQKTSLAVRGMQGRVAWDRCDSVSCVTVKL